jgi:hypothetical protein
MLSINGSEDSSVGAVAPPAHPGKQISMDTIAAIIHSVSFILPPFIRRYGLFYNRCKSIPASLFPEYECFWQWSVKQQLSRQCALIHHDHKIWYA